MTITTRTSSTADTAPTYRALAATIADSALAEGYAQAAIDAGWDPWRFRLTDADLEYLRGQQSDSPDGLPLHEFRQEQLEHDVQGEVRLLLAAAVERTQAGMTVELDSPVGPRVLVDAEAGLDAEDIEALLPEGWTVGDNWHLQIEVAGRYVYPLVTTD